MLGTGARGEDALVRSTWLRVGVGWGLRQRSRTGARGIGGWKGGAGGRGADPTRRLWGRRKISVLLSALCLGTGRMLSLLIVIYGSDHMSGTGAGLGGAQQEDSLLPQEQ